MYEESGRPDETGTADADQNAGDADQTGGPKIIDPADAEMLQDLIIAAHRDAKTKIEAVSSEEMQKVTGGMQLPPGMKLPF